MTNSNCPKCNSLPSNEHNPADWECGSSMRGNRHWQSYQCRAIEMEAEVERLREERDAWQSLDGINWHERAKIAEAEVERLQKTVKQLETGVLKCLKILRSKCSDRDKHIDCRSILVRLEDE